MRRVALEAAGTFGLVFLGTGACVVNAVSGGKLGVVGVGLAWGAAVWLLAATTGAHMNPAVTFATGTPKRDAGAYVLAQSAGAFAASLLLLAIFRGRAGNLGATLPAAGEARSFLLEAVMTFALVLAVLRLPGRWVPAAAGAIVAVEAILAGPLTGASMNPVRSLAPAVVSGNTSGLWLYLVAPMLGGYAARKVK